MVPTLATARAGSVRTRGDPTRKTSMNTTDSRAHGQRWSYDSGVDMIITRNSREPGLGPASSSAQVPWSVRRRGGRGRGAESVSVWGLLSHGVPTSPRVRADRFDDAVTCRVPKLSRSGYYDLRRHGPSVRDVEDAHLGDAG